MSLREIRDRPQGAAHPATLAARDADWELFTDWCAATGRCALPAAAADVEEFLRAVPGARVRRLRAIRRAHTAARRAIPAPATLTERAERLVPLSRALAQLPTLRYPVGLRGRRDGWLLVLLEELGLTRAQALALHELPALPRRVATAECPACVGSRWLRVLGPAWLGDRAEVRGLLDPRGADVDTHDCDAPLDDRWRASPTLLPAIDRHGWLSVFAPLSLTSVSAIVTARFAQTELPPGPVPVFTPTGRYANATSDELRDAFDEVNARLDELLTQVGAALADG